MTEVIGFQRKIDSSIEEEVGLKAKEAFSPDAAELARAANVLATIIFIVRQRGDELPNSYDVQCFDSFRRCATVMYDHPHASYAATENAEASTPSYDPTFGNPSAQVAELREQMAEMMKMLKGRERVRRPRAQVKQGEEK